MLQHRLGALLAVGLLAAACGSKSAGQRADSGADSRADGASGSADGSATADTSADLTRDANLDGNTDAPPNVDVDVDVHVDVNANVDVVADVVVSLDATVDATTTADAHPDAAADATPDTAAASCGGPCNTPPTACHAQLGSCVQGRCEYTFVEGALCDDANPCTIDDTCTGGACVGSPKICDAPPAPACTSSTDLRTYDRTGACSGGLCVYTRRTVACATSCSNGACQTDPCASVTCASPPSVCYAAAGTCQQGACSYAFADNAACDDGDACTDNDSCSAGVCRGSPRRCASPPADTCQDAFTAVVHDRLGTCSAGGCSYPSHFQSCATGCSNGACNGTGWTSMTSNTNQMLWAVWGSSASSVWAAGDAGTAIYFNGVTWQARPTPTEVATAHIKSVHGTTASNVFALAQGKLIHFDGTQWSYVAAIFTNSEPSAYCLAAYGDDVYAWGPTTSGGAALIRVSNLSPGPPTVTTLGTAAFTNFFIFAQCGIQVFSPTDIVLTGPQTVRYTGSATIAAIGTTASMAEESLWAAATGDIFVAPRVQRWTGGPAWASLTTGLNGTVHALSGTASSRVFAAGESFSTTPAQGTVLRWDGVGWTVEPIPDASQRLFGVWAAPTGEVFAVGANGAVLRGP